MDFQPGFDIRPTTDPMGFIYGADCFGPSVEYRTLDSIRQSLLDPDCSGPDPVYAIAMDTGKRKHLPALLERNLLYGVVTYAAGTLGREPVRSQGHVHKKARDNSMSPPEIYEIWSGRAIIYMQEHDQDEPGRCFAVFAGPGEVVIVPPDWAHATISADPGTPLTFGAWCDRNYGFDYRGVRAHRGLAWFPLIGANGEIRWVANSLYHSSKLMEKEPRAYRELGIRKSIPIYTHFDQDPDVFLYVSNPQLKNSIWNGFVP